MFNFRAPPPRSNRTSHMDRDDSTYQSSDQGKVKKSKKRPKKGSCIPCSKRRLKCDRTQPCASCIDKGITHLCKWESTPSGPNQLRSAAASPIDVDLTIERVDDGGEDEDELPAALRDTKLDLDQSSETLKLLSQRIQSLENWVVGSPESSASGSKASGVHPLSRSGDLANPEESYLQAGSSFTQAGTGGYSSGVPTPGVLSPLASPHASQRTHYSTNPQASEGSVGFSPRMSSALQEESYNQVAAFSLVHRGEYLGPGDVPSSLHSIRSPLSRLRLPFGSTTTATIPSSYPIKFAQASIPAPEIQHLVQYIPSVPSSQVIVDAFFKEVNWRYGIPEDWFKNLCSQMWTHTQNTPQNQQLSHHWLCLFFSILACAPQPGETPIIASRLSNTHGSLTYFTCASTARRLAEEEVLDRPLPSLPENIYFLSPVDGSVLVSLAVPLLCDFLAEKGRMSEAWKLVGGGIRSAQSIGLHRDPGSQMWQEMPAEEKDLRRRAWWGLYIWDSFLSHILGRPHMINTENCDVEKPSAFDENGQRIGFNLSRMVLIQLADITNDVLGKCMRTDQPMWMALSELDSKFHNWESNIPLEFRPGTTQEQDIVLFAGLSQSELQDLLRHRYMITTWYHFVRLKFGTLATSQLPLVPPATGNTRHAVHWAEKCMQSALKLINFQCDTFDHLRRTPSGERWVGENWYFEGCLSLLEAAVALVLVLTKYPATFLLPPGANMAEESRTGLKLEYVETTRTLSRTINVFSEIVMNDGELQAHVAGEGKRIEIATKGLHMLQILLKEHWWKLDPRTGKSSAAVVSPGLHLGFTALRGSASPALVMAGLSPTVDMVSAGMAAFRGSPFGSSEGSSRSSILSQTSPALSTGQVQQSGASMFPAETTSMSSPSSIRPHSSAYYANAPQLPAAVRAQFPSFFQEPSSPQHRPSSRNYSRDSGLPSWTTPASPSTFSSHSHTKSPSQSSPLNPNQQLSDPTSNFLMTNVYDTGHSATHSPFVSRPQPPPPPPSQGMRMIHYIAPGMKTRSTTTINPTAYSAYPSGMPGPSSFASEQAGDSEDRMED